MPAFPENVTDIATEAEARDAFARLAPARELAVDLEMDSMHAFRARLCFLQVGVLDEILLFDTLVPGVRADGLAQLFGDPERVKFFHAAGGDLQFLAEAGVRVHGLFDTHRAVTLLGWPKVGLADLARQLVGIELAKEHQQADFSIRPLPESMRAYIANDVRYLIEIGRQVREACVQADILEEVLLDCARLTDEAVGRPEVAPFQAKLPRGKLSAAELARAQATAATLHERRLAWAEAANVPMGRMLSNAAVTAIALKAPADLKALARSEGVRGGFVREHGEEVLALVKGFAERAAKGELQPESAPPRDAAARKREDALKTWRATKSSERKVTPSVVLSNASVSELAKAAPRTLEELSKHPYLGPKRLSLYGEDLLTLLRAD